MRLCPLFRSKLFAASAVLVVAVACAQTSNTDPEAAPPPAEPAVVVNTSPKAPTPPAEAPPPAPPPPPRFTTPSSKGRLALLYTASVEGYVAPCGCTADPLGGVARTRALLDEAKAHYGDRVLFVDAGNLLFEKLDDHHAADECQANARVDLLLDTYAEVGLAATTLGLLDDARGADWRDTRLAKRKLLTVGVNPKRPVDKAPFAASTVVQRGALRIGITGVFVDDEPLSVVNEQAKRIRPVLQAEVDALHKQNVDAVVVLAQATRRQTRLLLDGTSGIDVVLVGRRPGEGPTPAERLANGTVVLASGAQAQHIGIVELELGGRQAGAPLALDDGEERAAQRQKQLQKKIAQYEKQIADLDDGPRKTFIQDRVAGARDELKTLSTTASPAPKGPHLKARSVALTRESPADKDALAALNAYEASIPTLSASCEANVTCPEPKKGAPTYVGAMVCGECHSGAMKFWQKQTVMIDGKDKTGRPIRREVGHVKAWDTLVEDGKERDRSCVGCHSVGFMEPGGYCKTSDVDFREGVQCESCHGPGSLHVEAGGDAQFIPRAFVDERTCRGCHQVPHIPTTESFVYEEKLMHILGQGHGAAKRRELEQAQAQLRGTP